MLLVPGSRQVVSDFALAFKVVAAISEDVFLGETTVLWAIEDRRPPQHIIDELTNEPWRCPVTQACEER